MSSSSQSYKVGWVSGEVRKGAEVTAGENNAAAKATAKKAGKARQCADCPADISQLHGKARYCKACALKRAAANKLNYARKKAEAKKKSRESNPQAPVEAVRSEPGIPALPAAVQPLVTSSSSRAADANGQGGEKPPVSLHDPLHGCTRCGGYYRDGIDGELQMLMCRRCVADAVREAEAAEKVQPATRPQTERA